MISSMWDCDKQVGYYVVRISCFARKDGTGWQLMQKRVGERELKNEKEEKVFLPE